MRIFFTALASLTLITMVGCGTAHSERAESGPIPVEPSVTRVDEPLVLKASTFEEAEALCEEHFTGQEWEDCVDAALTGWCMFVPFPPESEFHTEEDARCIAEQAIESSPVLNYGQVEESK